MFSLSEITSLFDLSRYLRLKFRLSESLSQKVKSPTVDVVSEWNDTVGGCHSAVCLTVCLCL